MTKTSGPGDTQWTCLEFGPGTWTTTLEPWNESEPIPFTSWGEERHKATSEVVDGRLGRRDAVDPWLNECAPAGYPRILQIGASPFEFIQIPGRVMMLFEHDHLGTPDLDGWTKTPRGSGPDLDGVLGWPVGVRHAGHRHGRFQR